MLTLRILLLTLAISSCPFAQPRIFLNQIGYLPHQPKVIVLRHAKADSLYVYRSSGALRGVFPLSGPAYWSASQDSVRLADLTSLRDTGSYVLTIPGTPLRTTLHIAQQPYKALTNAALKFFYYQRASLELREQYAGPWKRRAGHPDTAVLLHPSTEAQGIISAPQGWYDAGDYGKYIVNSGITVYTLLKLYQDFPEKFRTRSWNIPESADSIPDLLNEIRWNLDWMLSMQAPDGGVYHKLTSLRFCGDIEPAADTDARYAIGKSTAATMNFAAVMAYSSRVFAQWDPTFSASMRQAAQRAYNWGLRHPDRTYIQPEDVHTGQYGDSDLRDEIFWASIELFAATGDSAYFSEIRRHQTPIQIPSWHSVNALGYFTIASHPRFPQPLTQQARREIVNKAKDLVAVSRENPYGISLENEDFVWGSNAVIANHAWLALQAFRVQPDTAFLQLAQRHLNYLLGNNPLGICFVTGFGRHSVRHPHHRPSLADSIADPVPGMLAGGPHTGGQDVQEPHNPVPWKCPEYRVEEAPARSYLDHKCSYATNEVAINWNAPLAYLSAALE